MRLIGHLSAEPDARRFCDYLLAGRRIAAHAEETPGGPWEIWVENDDDLDAGRDELRQYQATPADPRYDASADADRLRRAQAQAAERRRRNFKDVRTTMFSSPNGAIPVAITLIAISVVVGLMTNFGRPTTPTVLHALLFDDPGRYADDDAGSRFDMFNGLARGQLWRLVTPIFVHYGWPHLLFNMMWVLDLGKRIEPVKGSGRFAVVVLVVAVLSCFAQAAWTVASPWDGDHYSAFGGMSGVVAGLFGYAWMCGRFRPYERIGVTQQETGLMLGWLVICSFGVVGPIANAAHWGGLVVGMAMGAAPGLWKRR